VFIPTHQPRVTRNICRQNRRKLSPDSVFSAQHVGNAGCCVDPPHGKAAAWITCSSLIVGVAMKSFSDRYLKISTCPPNPD
jgi:hypothetical protein